MKLFLILLMMALPGFGWGEELPFVVHATVGGETVASVAAKYGASTGDVASANGLPAEDKPLAAGLTLLVPRSPEETLSTRYEAKRRGLGGWPAPRYQGEFLEPLTPPGPKAEGTAPPPEAEPPSKEAEKKDPAPAAREEGKENTYRVKEGDNLYRIAKNAQIPLASLMEANGLDENSIIKIGEELVIPGVKGDSVRSSGQEEKPADKAPPLSAQEPSRFKVRWPLAEGKAGRKPRGAGLFGPSEPGAAVYAPAAGTVLHGGWMKEFDNAIFIRHGDDFATFCGGLGIIYVTPGQQVTPETRIGLVGEMVDPGLQFNILKKGKAVDPALYLE